MVRNQCPGVAGRSCLREDVAETFQETISISVIEKDLPPTDSSTDDVMKCARCVYPRSPRHNPLLSHPL